MNKKIWLSSPHMGGTEQKFVNEAFDTNWVAPLGPNVNGLEADIQDYVRVQSAAALTSGTAAIHLALILSGVEHGDEVICQSFTFSASANPIRYQGATPVFIDSEPETWNMCPELLREAIEDRIKKGKKPKAIIAVHLYGMPAKMPEIMEVAREFEIPVIEDAAEALGSHINGKMCGSFGDFGILSFNGNKIITTSGGGALLSNNEEAIKKARYLATQARDEAPWYQHSEVGYNYRMSNIAAGIGRGQMEVLNQRIKARRANFDYYVEKLRVQGSRLKVSSKETLNLEPSNPKQERTNNLRTIFEPWGYFSNRWLTTILINPELPITSHLSPISYPWYPLYTATQDQNIETRPLWKPMHMQPVFSKYPAYLNGTSENLFHHGLCLPSGSNLTKEDLNRVIATLKNTLN